jgi:hypothetical protein
MLLIEFTLFRDAFGRVGDEVDGTPAFRLR